MVRKIFWKTFSVVSALIGVGFLFVCAFYNITGATLLAVFLIALVNLFVCDLLWRSVDDD